MVDRIVHRPGRCKRPKTTAILGACAAMFDDARVIMIFGDQDIGKAFVIPQKNVVTRLELLDQVGFKKKGFGLGMGGDDFHPDRLRDHTGNPDRQLHDAGIGHHALFKVLGLADIKNPVLVIEHPVNARCTRHGFQGVFDCLDTTRGPAPVLVTFKGQTDFPPRGSFPVRVFGGGIRLHKGTPQSDKYIQSCDGRHNLAGLWNIAEKINIATPRQGIVAEKRCPPRLWITMWVIGGLLPAPLESLNFL